ncbi:vWA domain-containing protein, partial [Deinococcus marmoris]
TEPPTEPPTEPAATTGTINGVRFVDVSTYQFGFTPLKGTDIVGTATLKSVTVKNLSAGAASARVCGNVEGQDVVTATLSLDSTGSMQDTDPGKLRNTAARAFVDRMGPSDKAAILSFDTATSPSEDLLASYLWQDFTGDRALLTKAVDQATFIGGGTPLYDAMLDASALLKASGGRNARGLVLTDGQDTGSFTSPAQVIAAANKNGTPLYIIGLDAQDTLDFRDAEDIAARTGGLFQKATSAGQLQKFFDNVYNAFRAQGCVELKFTQKPAAGTAVTGQLAITVGAADRKDSVVEVPFTVDVR